MSNLFLSYKPSRHINNSLKLFSGITFLLLGCMIYFSWRNEHTNLYVWCKDIGMGFIPDFLHASIGKTDPGSFIRNSLPDGLYCSAYVLIMDYVWQQSRLSLRVTMTLLIPLVAVIHEILQYFKIISGTFDMTDIVCYVIPVLTYLLYIISQYIHLKTK